MLKYSETSYINLFREDYLQRKEKNPLYSIRSYAKYLDLTPAYVSMIFREKRHLSHSTAIRISKKLKWSREKQKYFVNLLEFQNPKSEESKEAALINLQALESTNVNFSSLEIDTFEAIAGWHYSAILTLLTLLKNKATIALISKRLNLNTTLVENAMIRLQRLGLVKKESYHWKGIFDYLRLQSTPSDAIRLFHKQHLIKASKAIEEQSFDERDFSNMTITVDRAKIPLAKKKIAEFHHEMAKILDGKNSTEVYQLSVQLFRLTEPAGE